MDIILQTSRLLLRRFTDSDADAALVYELNKDPQVLKYLQEPVLKNKTQAHNILQKIILPQYKNDFGRWAIHLQENNEFIGWCGLKYRPEKKETDLGYRLKKTAWGSRICYRSSYSQRAIWIYQTSFKNGCRKSTCRQPGVYYNFTKNKNDIC